MASTPDVVIHFRDLEVEEELRDDLEQRLQKRVQTLSEEFPETRRFEITLFPDGVGHEAHAHVSGKNTQLATHATAEELSVAVDQLVDRIEKQLRKAHDKRIFVQRREAQKSPPKRHR